MTEMHEIKYQAGMIDPLNKALEKCVEEWTKNAVPDWKMIGYCSKQQAEAWRKLHPDG